ncbi:RNA polymerase sigma-70 factor (ECF subfamily) [Chitinophaga skermanii]|uniref:RNA polymerase sigma-70 factor (ECF subfamily) n=1 Tax=Chitinophaga skermanii TaxID=331697 RepID=A0A327QN30_9BACT|nr:RNA polymerase sigma-70 factor [Chitinophaga skermanii]RAJ05448.1 RNA polymerase sigma-70 factor (ECF subfamily) [Chitinophaga skermanii]
MTTVPPTELLLHDWLTGDDVQFKPLFEYYFPRLQRYAKGFIEDHALREELVMNVLLKVWQQKTRISNVQDFDRYVFTMMRHEVVSMMRKKKMNIDTLSETTEETPALDNINDTIHYRELLSRYRQCLDKLPPRRREAFILNREKGLSYAEIASILNVSIFTVQNHIASSLKFMRTELEEYADFLPVITVISVSMLTVY